MIVVETRIHRTFGGTSPHTVLVLVEHCAAATTQTEAYDDRLGIRSLNAEASITLTIHHRIFLTGLVQGIGHEILLWLAVVEVGIEVTNSPIACLWPVLLVERQRMVVHAKP